MKFSMKTPCPECPFRSDVKPYLRVERVEEIIEAITDHQQTFACHKTTKFDDYGEHLSSASEQHCAGALIFLERIKRPNQMMRIMERLGEYDRTRLDMDAPVYEDPDAMIDAYIETEA